MPDHGSDDYKIDNSHSRRLQRTLLVLGVFAGIVLVVVVYLSLHHPIEVPIAVSIEQPDPRLRYNGPFKNIHPEIRYASEASCVDCHLDIAKTYEHHPMARTLQPIQNGSTTADLNAKPLTFQALQTTFRIVQRDKSIRHVREKYDANNQLLAELHWDVHYQVGSGNHGHSYLSVMDDYLFQTPISWYSTSARIDLSPGFTEALSLGRPVVAECLFCHANHANIIDDSENRYQKPIFDTHGIGCQRCHGPGSLHVQSREQGVLLSETFDDTIVNPRHLSAKLRDAVCEQCHLEGEIRVLRESRSLYDFRPGMALEEFWNVFLSGEGEGEKQAVGHVEQMHLSRCYLGSEGENQLGCISCHDPHKAVRPDEKLNYYRDKCNQCHTSTSCGLPSDSPLREEVQDSCIACHMPRYRASDVPHTASTDHRIIRFKNTPLTSSHRAVHPRRLASFFEARKTIQPSDMQRDHSLAIAKVVRGGKTVPLPEVQSAFTVLQNHLRERGSDREALAGAGFLASALSQPQIAFQYFESVLLRSPNHEMSVVGSAVSAEQLNQVEKALGFWKQACQLAPFNAQYRASYCNALARLSQWNVLVSEAEEWVKLNPFSIEARVTLLKALIALQQLDRARTEFNIIERFNPPNILDLRIRYASKLGIITPN